MMRRPSCAICTEMPSPMPPKPSSRWCESSLKFRVTTPLRQDLTLRRTAGLLTLLGDFLAALLAFLAAVFRAAGFFFLEPENDFFTDRNMLFARFITCSVA